MVKLIGVLAGMGPFSTAPFIDLMMQICSQKYHLKEDDEFPPVMIHSCPTPFRVDQPIDHFKMRDALKKGISLLNKSKVDYIGMASNSAYAYYDDLIKTSTCPILHIAEEVQKKLKPVKTALLCTELTWQTQIYQTKLAHSIPSLTPNFYQEQLNTIIKLIKLNDKDQALSSYNTLLNELSKQDVKQFILACTELNAVNTIFDDKFIDSSTVLAEALLCKFFD